MNSSYGNDARIAAKLGAESVVLHPDDAEARGIREGDAVSLENATGRLTLVARIAATIPTGVALAGKSPWPKQLPQGANINALNPGRKTDMGESSAVHGVEVMITRNA
jgi:anaerobic selenocysteine-containing dehydrogenase